MDYIAYLHKEGKSDFGVSFPDFPGCVTAGKPWTKIAAEQTYFWAAKSLSEIQKHLPIRDIAAPVR